MHGVFSSAVHFRSFVVFESEIVPLLNNGMSIMGIGIEWQQAVKGLVLLLAVAFDVYNKRRSGASVAR